MGVLKTHAGILGDMHPLGISLGSTPWQKMTLSTPQTVTNLTESSVLLDTRVGRGDGWYTVGGNGLAVPLDGIYLIKASLGCAPSGPTGRSRMRVVRIPADLSAEQDLMQQGVHNSGMDAVGTALAGSISAPLKQDDAVYLSYLQNSGGNGTLNANDLLTYLTVVWRGPM